MASSLRSARTALATLVLLVSGASCGAAPAPSRPPVSAARCAPGDLVSCERAIAGARAGGREPRAQIDAWADARRARDSHDGWAELWDALRKAEGPRAALLIEGDAAPGEATQAAAREARIVRVPLLGKPAVMDEVALLVAMGEAAGIDVLVRMRGRPAEVTEIFPDDPLRPFLSGIAPVVRDDGAIGHLAEDLALAASIRRAAEHAGAFRYVEAAREAEVLGALLEKRDAQAETTLRGRYLLSQLGFAGIRLAAPKHAPPRREPAPPPPPAAADTAYGDLLRVRTARDERAAFRVRSERILSAVPASRREALAALFRPAEVCAPVKAPPMQGPDDLAFAYALAGALAEDPLATPPPAGSSSPDNPRLSLPAWLERYDALVRAVDDAHAAWAHVPALVRERGEIAGVRLGATPTHRRVTRIVVQHLEALAALQKAHPGRVQAAALLPLAYARGALGDGEIAAPLVALLEKSTEDDIAAASDAGAVFEAALTAALGASTYPEALQAATFRALDGALRRKLDGDLARATGWGTAGLFAADAALRYLRGQKPDLAVAASAIDRALADASVPQRPLARLTTSATRYAVLAVSRELDPDTVDPARMPKGRRDAREALREALAGLAEDGDPLPRGLLDDMTSLGDQTIAALAEVALATPKEAVTKGAGGEKDAQEARIACANASAGLSPAARRAVARLGDLRRKLMTSPSYKKGEGASMRRARLFVTLLSDAIDVVGRAGKRPTFFVPTAEAERSVREALAGLSSQALADALGTGYGLFRAYHEATSAEGLVSDGERMGRLFSSLSALFREGGAGGGVALLDAFARAGTVANGRDIAGLLVSYARALRAQGKPDQADLCLLGAILPALLTDRPPADEAIAEAAAQGSRAAWALRFAREIRRAQGGGMPDTATYAPGMREAVENACRDAADVDAVVGVMDAVRAFREGKRTEARAALDELLAKAEAHGLDVPRLAYKYEEKTTSRVFSLSLEMSFGAGVVEGASSFKLGLGVRSPGEPSGTFTVGLSPPDTKSDTSAGRYYVHTAAIAAGYHFLDGDAERGAAAAVKAIEASVRGLRLGKRRLLQANPIAFAADAKAMLAVDAVLAADAGMPLLAGDLFSLVRGALPADVDDHVVDELLASPPFGLRGVASAEPLIQRARRTVKILAEPMACTEAKIEASGLETPACDGYPLALSLRAGGALRKLPRLAGGPSCAGSLAALDTLLGGLETGTYDPDAFTRAVEALRGEGRPYDAAVLLARQRRPSHCNPTLLTAARALGRAPSVGPSLRADVLTVAVNCAPEGASSLDDLAAIDAETTRMADPSRNLALLVFASRIGLSRGNWQPLAHLAKSPAFIDRWLDTSPRAVLFALALAEAAPILGGAPRSAPSADAAYALFCKTLPQADGAGICDTLDALRRPGQTPDIQRALARKAVEEALSGVAK